MRKQFSKFTINKDKSRKGKKGVQHWIIRIAKTEHNAKYKTRFSGTFDEATAKAEMLFNERSGHKYVEDITLEEYVLKKLLLIKKAQFEKNSIYSQDHKKTNVQLAPQSWRAWIRDMKRFMQVLGQYELRKITDEHIEKLWDYYIDKEYSPRSIYRYLLNVKGVLLEAKNEDPPRISKLPKFPKLRDIERGRLIKPDPDNRSKNSKTQDNVGFGTGTIDFKEEADINHKAIMEFLKETEKLDPDYYEEGYAKLKKDNPEHHQFQSIVVPYLFQNEWIENKFNYFEHFKVYLKLLVTWGFRPNEGRGLLWENINLEKEEFELINAVSKGYRGDSDAFLKPHNKNWHRRVIPLMRDHGDIDMFMSFMDWHLRYVELLKIVRTHYNKENFEDYIANVDKRLAFTFYDKTKKMFRPRAEINPNVPSIHNKVDKQLLFYDFYGNFMNRLHLYTIKDIICNNTKGIKRLSNGRFPQLYSLSRRSYLTRNGTGDDAMAVPVLMNIVGHKDIKTTMQYINPSEDTIRKAQIQSRKKLK